jgi:ankyrin repeat protein
MLQLDSLAHPYRFVWVEIWLKILLPTYNDQRNVQSKEEANKLLKALKSSSSEHNEAYAQLKSGYQRLWDFNVMRSDELRPRLFHLALCSFEPLTLASITHALRIRVEKDSEDELYDEDLTVEQVKRLYSNFLTENLAGKLVFVHDSAKDFVRKLKIQVPVGSESKDVDEFSEKRNHMSAAKLYIEVVKRANHPVWQHVDIDPSKWREFVHIGFSYWFAEYSKWAKLDGKGNILPYIVQYGLRHCSEAAKKRSLSDHLWKDVLHKLVLSPQSAFLYVGLLAKFPFFKWPNIPSVEFRNLIGEYKGHIELFTSHVLAWLEITDDDDTSDSRLPSSKEDPVTDDWLFQQLSKHVLYRGQSTLGTSNFGMTALQIACLTRNNATVKLILKATHYMYGHDNRATMDLLFHDPQFDEAPIIIAIKDRQDDIVRTLLEFEIQHADRTIDDQWEGVPRHSPKVLQWSNRDRGGYTALNLAIRRFDEKSICALLRLAQPRDINFREEISGNTALHVAVRNGFLQLIRDLAEEYNADIEVENGFQQTPCGFAYQRGEVEAMKYLVSKGAAVRLPAAEAGNVEHTSKGGDIWDPSQSRSELNEGESYSGGPAEIPPSTLPHPKSRFNETHHQHHQSGLHRRIRMGQAPRPTVA